MKYFHIYKDAIQEWRWRYVEQENGRIIAGSGEGYKNRSDCFAGIGFMKASSLSPVFEVKKNSSSGKAEWVQVTQ